MLAWRIAKLDRALDRTGFGASIRGQRWNGANVPAIYAGLTPEIAALEKLVHTGPMLPRDLVLVRVVLPEKPALYDVPAASDLPAGWDALPGSPAAAAYGDAFLLGRKYLGLVVPSAVMPEAQNIVVNPLHPAMEKVRFEIVRTFNFDPRLRR